jgi:hypothetical protein
MDSRFSLPACLVLLCGVIALGTATAEAAGIGVHLNPNTRSIQPGGAGESTASRSPRYAIDVKASRQSAALQGFK